MRAYCLTTRHTPPPPDLPHRRCVLKESITLTQVVELGRNWLGEQYTRCSRVQVELQFNSRAAQVLVTAVRWPSPPRMSFVSMASELPSPPQRGSNPVVLEQGEAKEKKKKKKKLLTKGEQAVLHHLDALYLVPQDVSTRFVVQMPQLTSNSSSVGQRNTKEEGSEVLALALVHDVCILPMNEWVVDCAVLTLIGAMAGSW